MQYINQNSAIQSLRHALTAAPGLIDSRSEKDMLRFISGFAAIINFYDQNNNKSGSWLPFVLKDQVILAATIAGTPFKKEYSLYTNTIKKLSLSVYSQNNTTDAAQGFNQVFDQLTAIFARIKMWVSFMQDYKGTYPLKDYVIHEATITLTPYFRALNSLRQSMYLSGILPGIVPLKDAGLPVHSAYNERVWKENLNHNPYWEILGLNYPLKENTLQDILQAVKNAANMVFSFYKTAIHHADKQYSAIEKETVSYSDTVLIRSFINMLQIHREQLNDITNRHLEFYYKEILKQRPQGAVADTAYLYATLTKKEPYLLPAGTLFNAGTDANKQPVLFANTTAVQLNPAVITQAKTLSLVQDSALGNYKYYSNTIQNPGEVKKSEKGAIQPWETFGGTIGSTAVTNSSGIAFASPILLLREGKRKIVLDFNLTQQYDLSVFKNAKFYLSTQKAWLDITSNVQLPQNLDSGQAITITILLDESQPAIEAFTNKTENIESKWPLLKLGFDALPDPSAPPVLASLGISVSVSGLKSFKLYNDYGALNAKNPYPLFGPMPAENSNFIVGNDEIFSKSVTSLFFELDWNSLPTDFAEYYKEYNIYLDNQSNPPKKNNDVGNTTMFSRMPRVFRKRQDETLDTNGEINPLEPFNNCCFTVNFQLLQEGEWIDVAMDKLEDININKSYDIESSPYGTENNCPTLPTGTMLFSTDDTPNHYLTKTSYFGYNTQNSISYAPLANGCAGIQANNQNYNAQSRCGYFRLTLTGNTEGFGAALYAKVITERALKNAVLVAKKDVADLLSQPNRPYTPSLSLFLAHYTTSVQYDFTTGDTSENVECYRYTPFTSFRLYQSATNTPPGFNAQVYSNGVPLYNAQPYLGMLILKMDNVSTANVLNIYTELAASATRTEPSCPPSYFYLSVSGWQELKVIADTTNNYTCSGIIRLNLPADMADNSPVMPEGGYYIAMAAKDIADYSKTICINTNGFAVERVLNSNTDEITRIKAGTIAKPQQSIAQIAKVVQPFPSFNGKPAEDTAQMNQRVSNRIKTKSRSVNIEDYYRNIINNFPQLYYANTVYNKAKRLTEVYVVPQYESMDLPNALQPQATACLQSEINLYLNGCSAAFTKIQVKNYALQYVTVYADIIAENGFESATIKQVAEEAITNYLSPWVVSNSEQAIIGKPVTAGAIAAVLNNINGIARVQQVAFTYCTDDIVTESAETDSIAALNTGYLMVSSEKHNITISN